MMGPIDTLISLLKKKKITTRILKTNNFIKVGYSVIFVADKIIDDSENY
jgi:hypothetical protein